MLPPEYVIPMTSEEEVDGIASLQEFVMGINEENLIETKQILIQSSWIKYRKEVAQIARTLVITARHRTDSIGLLVDVFYFLVSNANDENFLGYLKNDVMRTIFRSMFFVKPFPVECSTFAFLFESMNAGIFSDQEIVDKIHSFTYQNPNFIRSASWLFFWFAPEIYHLNYSYYHKLFNILTVTAADRPNFPAAFRKFFDRINDYIADDFALLRSARLQSQHRLTILSIIKRDAVSSAIKFFSFPNNSLTARLDPSVFCANPFIQYRPSFLQVAAFYGSVTMFKYFLLNRLDVNEVDNKMNTLAQFAVAGANLEIIQLCEELGCTFKCTAHVAAMYHHIHLLKWIHTTKHQDLSGIDNAGMNVLHRAAESNCIQAIKYCLDNGCDINASSADGATALRIAVRRGNIDTVRFLVGIPGIDLNAGAEVDRAPIHVAAKYGDLQIIRLLTTFPEVDINMLDRDGETPLMHAAGANQATVVRFLLSFPNINVNVCGPNGTAFHKACASGSTIVLGILLHYPGLDITIPYPGGYTGIHTAVKNKQKRVLLMLLEDKRIDVNESSTKGETALHTAARYGRSSIVTTLLNYNKTDPNPVTNEGITPLMLAACAGMSKTVERLLSDPRVDPNAQTPQGDSALSMSIESDCLGSFKVLCKCDRVNVNITTPDNRTPLHDAVIATKKEFIKTILLRKDLNPNIATKSGFTPLITSVVSDKPNTASILLNDPRVDPHLKICHMIQGKPTMVSAIGIAKGLGSNGIKKVFAKYINSK